MDGRSLVRLLAIRIPFIIVFCNSVLAVGTSLLSAPSTVLAPSTSLLSAVPAPQPRVFAVDGDTPSVPEEVIAHRITRIMKVPAIMDNGCC